jgi:Mg2+ and Co2+ transporter CorA
MIDLAVAKSAIDLFKEFLELIDRRNRNKREVFERTCKPLFESLEPIMKDYYSTIKHIQTGVTADNPDIAAILRDIDSQRTAFVIARNGIFGAADALKHRYSDGAVRIAESESFNSLAYDFAESIRHLFSEATDVEHLSMSILSNLVSYLQDSEDDVDCQQFLVRTRRMLSDASSHLEHEWTKLSRKFAALKLYCNA